MRRAFFVFLFVINSSAVAGWMKLYEHDDLVYYADYSSLHSFNKYFRLWFLADYKFPQNMDGLKFRSVKYLYEIDCANEYTRLVSSVAYAGGAGMDNVVANYNYHDDWQSIPDSQAGNVLGGVCTYDRLRKEYANPK